MTSCSLVAEGLMPQVSNQAPTFSYHRTGHNDDFFGIQMTYMNGASTCYSGYPRFTPVIQNPAKGFSVECQFSVAGSYSGIYCPNAPVTKIPDGTLTVSYKNWLNHQPTPVPFPAVFGPSPTSKTVTAVASVVATSTATKTSTISGEFASTATTYLVGTTRTSTSTVTITKTKTTTNTNYISSCREPTPFSSTGKSSTSAAPSTPANTVDSSSAGVSPKPSATTTYVDSSSTVTTSTVPAATPSGVCPGSDGQTINTSAGDFLIECGIDRSGNDMKNSPVYPGSYEGCIAACAGRTGCMSVSYVPNGPCYLKSSAGTATKNSNIIGGRLISESPYPSATPSSTSTEPETTTPMQTVTVTTTVDGTNYQCTCTPTSGMEFEPVSSAPATPSGTLDCPSSNGSVFTSDCGATYAIECYSDRYGSDIQGGTSYASTLDECIAHCDNTEGCIDVSYSPGPSGPCYKKSSISDARGNDAIFGARQLTGCTASTKLKLHRKRVVHQPTEPKKNVQKRWAYGPDLTFIPRTTTVTKTSTSTSVRTTTITKTLSKDATTTKTLQSTSFTTATATVTADSKVTQTQQLTVTTCPAAAKSTGL